MFHAGMQLHFPLGWISFLLYSRLGLPLWLNSCSTSHSQTMNRLCNNWITLLVGTCNFELDMTDVFAPVGLGIHASLYMVHVHICTHILCPCTGDILVVCAPSPIPLIYGLLFPQLFPVPWLINLYKQQWECVCGSTIIVSEFDMLHITILPLKESSGFKTFILPCVRNVCMNLIALSPGF